MSITWETFRAKLARLLDDALRGESDTPTWANDELLDYINFALTALADHTAQTKVKSYSATSDLTSVELPVDLLELGPVWFPDRVLVTPLALEPGLSFADMEVTTSSQPVSYYRWPDDTLNLMQAVPAGEQLTLYYWAYWDTVEQESSVIKIPKWAEEAANWYCMSLAMSKPGVSAAQLGSWKTKKDSGTPEHNAPRAFADYCKGRYEAVLAGHARQDRTGWESRMS